MSETPLGPDATSSCDGDPCYDVADVCLTGCARGGYICTCADPDRYGQSCQNRDGGIWSSWTLWSQCFLTRGPKTRHRVCEEPTPLSDGVPCPGLSDDIQDCGVTYEFEALADVCDVAVHEDSLSVDDCIIACQNDVQCSGIMYDHDVCKRYEGKTESYDTSGTLNCESQCYGKEGA